MLTLRRRHYRRILLPVATLIPHLYCSAITMEKKPNWQRTFYRRPLPETCTALSSKEGRALFESALSHKGLKSLFPLMEQFTTQAEPAYCGISTLVIVLNALAVDPRQTWKEPWRWYTESMLNCCVDLEVMKQTGITLQTFACLAKCQGLDVLNTHASEATVSDFRNAVRLACDEESASPEGTIGPFLVVSYDRKVLQQTGSGHFSPIAAYDEVSDRLLILDTARFKYGAHWAPLELLFEAMQPLDTDTRKSRGYVLLSFHEDAEHSTLPLSLLFRTSQNKNAERKRYKDFLHARGDAPVTLEDVTSYWTKGGLQSSYIWEMTKAQFTPTSEKDKQVIASVRRLIADLLPTAPEVHQYCYLNANRTLRLSPQEAIFVVYLASIDAEKRKEIVLQSESSVPTETKHQLLAEAELLQLAIEMSDKLDNGGSID